MATSCPVVMSFFFMIPSFLPYHCCLLYPVGVGDASPTPTTSRRRAHTITQLPAPAAAAQHTTRRSRPPGPNDQWAPEATPPTGYRHHARLGSNSRPSPSQVTELGERAPVRHSHHSVGTALTLLVQDDVDLPRTRVLIRIPLLAELRHIVQQQHHVGVVPHPLAPPQVVRFRPPIRPGLRLTIELRGDDDDAPELAGELLERLSGVTERLALPIPTGQIHQPEVVDAHHTDLPVFAADLRHAGPNVGQVHALGVVVEHQPAFD